MTAKVLQKGDRDVPDGEVVVRVDGTTEPGPLAAMARQYADLCENPRGYCPNHSTGVKLPDDFVATHLQYVD